jgi:hypothetical protein
VGRRLVECDHFAAAKQFPPAVQGTRLWISTLGFSSIEAYALERCERSASWTQKARGLARRLERLPVIEDALISGSLSWSMAAVLATVACPDDSEFWLAEAARRTVREMKALVLERRGAVDDVESLEAEEELRTLTLTVPREDAWYGWRRLGYATAAQYARERLGTSLSSIKAKRWLVKRLDELRFLADALERGELGYEAARLVARVATRATVEGWVTRATERTLKHLREEIDAAKLLARWSECAAVLPPSDAEVRRVADLERAVVTGQMSAPPASPASVAAPANVTLRLRVHASTARDFRHSHGGDDSDQNVTSLCTWCHVEGIHRGQISAAPPASRIRWTYGRRAHTVVEGRRRVRAGSSVGSDSPDGTK